MYSYLLEELSKTIGARLLTRFEYTGKIYTVEPHLLGRNQQKQDCLLAWVSSCPSAPASEGKWHVFLLSNIEHVVAQEERFYKQRPGYDPYDSSMSRIYYRL